MFELIPDIIFIVGKVKMNSKCCGYGVAADNIATAFDCAIIPGASKAATAGGLAQTLPGGAGNGFCGGDLGTVTNSADAATVCCE